MILDHGFVEAQRQKALHPSKWKSLYFAGFLAFIHPGGMLHTSVPAFLAYLAIWLAMLLYWKGRPFGTVRASAAIFGICAYAETKWRNAAIEKWKYGLK